MEVPYGFGVILVKGQGHMRTLFENCFHTVINSETVQPRTVNFTQVLPLDHWGGHLMLYLVRQFLGKKLFEVGGGGGGGNTHHI